MSAFLEIAGCVKKLHFHKRWKFDIGQHKISWGTIKTGRNENIFDQTNVKQGLIGI